jgi:hypothetical protein
MNGFHPAKVKANGYMSNWQIVNRFEGLQTVEAIRGQHYSLYLDAHLFRRRLFSTVVWIPSHMVALAER